VIDAAEMGFLRPLGALTRQDKQRENTNVLQDYKKIIGRNVWQ